MEVVENLVSNRASKKPTMHSASPDEGVAMRIVESFKIQPSFGLSRSQDKEERSASLLRTVEAGYG